MLTGLAIFLWPWISLGKASRLLRALNQPSLASHQLFHKGRTKVPLCSTGLRPLRGRCPASPHCNSQSSKAGQRVSLTTYCPWATCLAFRGPYQILGGPQKPRSPFLQLFLVSYSFSLFAASRERKRTAAASGRSCSAAYEQQQRYKERTAKKSQTSDWHLSKKHLSPAHFS